MRFVFINRFYWPDEPATAQLLTDLAEALTAAGHSVAIIASRPHGAVTAVEERNGVSILRAAGTRRAKGGLIGKLVDFATFYVGAMVRLFMAVRSGDTVVALTDPPLIGVGAWLVARIRGAYVVHWAQDIYPEIAITLTGHRWLAAVRPLRNAAWRRADACVTLGSDMAAVLLAAGVKPHRLTVIPNWAPAGLSPQPSSAADSLRAAWGLTGKFVVLYSGNLGRVHDLEPLLDVAENLRAHTHITLLFIGNGAQRAALAAEASRRGLPNVRFQPPQPRADLAASLALGDLHVVTLRPGCEGFVFPSKLYGIAAVGRPVLFMGPKDCEIAALIRQNSFGHTFTREEIVKLAGAISDLSIAPATFADLAAAAARFATLSGDATNAARRWAALAVGLPNA